MKWEANTQGVFFYRDSGRPRLGTAEQADGGEAGALALGSRVLEEDGGAAGCWASERGAGHARLERAQFFRAAAGRRRKG